MEAALLAAFMLSACLFAVLLFHPAGAAVRLWPEPLMRRVLMGLAMGSTAVALTYSPWGQRSGAHYNPALTLAFARLGKVRPWDAAAYIAAQFAGAVAGVLLARVLLRDMLGDAMVHYAVTRPGPAGALPAFLAEVLISGLLMTVVLTASNHPRAARFTGVFAGLLVASFIIFESPVSGMSMNPARTVGSGFWAHDWTAVWIYFTAPPLGMLLAAEWYLRRHGAGGIFCAKLHHQNDKRCIFCESRAAGGRPAGPIRGGNLSPTGRIPVREPKPHSLDDLWRSRRMKRQTWILGLAVIGGIGWWAFRPERLFVRTHVNEAAPMSQSTAGATASPSVLSGSFHSVAHETHGRATILRLPDGRLLLRLTDFATSNGPDVRVYLVAAPDAADNSTVTRAGFLELGKLKGTDGDQNYDVPTGTDLNRYRAVTIWCRRFAVNFATAPLTPAT